MGAWSRAAGLIFTMGLLNACATPPPRTHADLVPAGSLRVGQVIQAGTRDEILGAAELMVQLRASGVTDDEIVDGSVIVARIYCCGGVSKEMSAEYEERRVMFVPNGQQAAQGDFVEYRVGIPPSPGEVGRFNTLTRVVARYGDVAAGCWWEPKDDRLWLRVAYCDWMEKEGWIKQGGISPAWFKPTP